MKINTILKCKCGKEFKNTTEIGKAFSLAIHLFKQVFFDIAFILHSIKKDHGFIEKYENYTH